MKSVPWRELGWATAFVALLALLYVGSYFAVVSPSSDAGFHVEAVEFVYLPKYRIVGGWATIAFAPIHQLDVSMRPHVWTGRFGGSDFMQE